MRVTASARSLTRRKGTRWVAEMDDYPVLRFPEVLEATLRHLADSEAEAFRLLRGLVPGVCSVIQSRKLHADAQFGTQHDEVRFFARLNFAIREVRYDFPKAFELPRLNVLL